MCPPSGWGGCCYWLGSDDDDGRQQQLQNWKIKIIFLCRRILYEPLHPSWRVQLNFIIGWFVAGSSYGGVGLLALHNFKQWAQHGRRASAREKINFLPNNRSSSHSRLAPPRVGWLVGGWMDGLVVVRKSYSEMMKISSAEQKGRERAKKAWKQMQPVINCMP